MNFEDQEREALSAILEILHSSQQGEGEGFGGELNDRLIEGLLVAGRLIAEAPLAGAQRAARPRLDRITTVAVV